MQHFVNEGPTPMFSAGQCDNRFDENVFVVVGKPEVIWDHVGVDKYDRGFW